MISHHTSFCCYGSHRDHCTHLSLVYLLFFSRLSNIIEILIISHVWQLSVFNVDASGHWLMVGVLWVLVPGILCIYFRWPRGMTHNKSRIRFYPYKIETLFLALRALIKFLILLRIKFSPRINYALSIISHSRKSPIIPDNTLLFQLSSAWVLHRTERQTERIWYCDFANQNHNQTVLFSRQTTKSSSRLHVLFLDS